MKEIYKDIDFLIGYQISNLGNIRNSKQKQLKPFKNSKGYLYVNPSVSGKRKTIAIHILVALLFVDNPENKPQINHKDGNKENNISTNLEWVDNSENVKHAYKTGLNNGSSLKVNQHDLNHNYINTYPSISDAANENNLSATSLWKCCNNKRKTSGNFIWEYCNKE